MYDYDRSKKASPGNVLRKEVIAGRLEKLVNELLDVRATIRLDYDMLHDLYEDSMGLSGFPGYASADVKHTRDSVHMLDNEIGNTYRSAEHLSRLLKKHVSGT